MENYLIWSNEHRAWWRPKRRGYTVHIASAGRYTREQAIQESRVRDQRPGEIMPEIPVLEADVLACQVEPPQSYRDDPRPSEVIARDGWPADSA